MHGDSQRLAWIDGRVVPLGRARVSLLDRGYLLGDGVFETLRTARGRLFAPSLHERRLRQGAASLGLPAHVSAKALRAARVLVRVARARPGHDLYLRLMVTTGTGEGVESRPGAYAVAALCRPFAPYPARAYTRGLTVIVDAVRTHALGPRQKTMSFADHVASRREARRRGADDAILLNDAGRVAEATTSNVIAVVGRTLRAPGPEEGAVDGVTRTLLLAQTGRKVIGRLSVQDLEHASEVFLTNTIGGVVPVRTIRGVKGRLGGPTGPVTREFQKRYSGLMHEVR